MRLFCLGKCPAGYYYKYGNDMNSQDQEDKMTLEQCGEACTNSTECCSFEWSPSREVCGFNKGCIPTHVQYKDNIFCIPNDKSKTYEKSFSKI